MKVIYLILLKRKYCIPRARLWRLSTLLLGSLSCLPASVHSSQSYPPEAPARQAYNLLRDKSYTSSEDTTEEEDRTETDNAISEPGAGAELSGCLKEPALDHVLTALQEENMPRAELLLSQGEVKGINEKIVPLHLPDVKASLLGLSVFFEQLPFTVFLLKRKDALRLDVDSPIEYSSGYAETPLTCALASGLWEMGKALIRADANPNGLDPAGLSPLKCAISYGHLPMVRLLLQGGALADFPIPTERADETSSSPAYLVTPLYHLVHVKQKIHTLCSAARLLIRYGASPDTRVVLSGYESRSDAGQGPLKRKWDTPFLAAIQLPDTCQARALTRFFLRKGASLRLDQDYFGYASVLSWARAHNLPDILPLLEQAERKRSTGQMADSVRVLRGGGTRMRLLPEKRLPFPRKGTPRPQYLIKGGHHRSTMSLSPAKRSPFAWLHMLYGHGKQTALPVPALCNLFGAGGPPPDRALARLEHPLSGMAGEEKAFSLMQYLSYTAAAPARRASIFPVFYHQRILYKGGKKPPQPLSPAHDACMPILAGPAGAEDHLSAAIGQRLAFAALAHLQHHLGVAPCWPGRYDSPPPSLPGYTTPLGRTILRKDVLLASQLLGDKLGRTDPDEISLCWGTDSFTALWLAVCYHHSLLVRLLLDHGADPGVPGTGIGCFPPLFQAVCQGAGNIASLLLTHPGRKARPDQLVLLPHGGFSTALLEAVQLRDADMVERLLQEGAPVDQQVYVEKDRKSTALIEAIRSRQPGLAQQLIAHRADLRLEVSPGVSGATLARETRDPAFLCFPGLEEEEELAREEADLLARLDSHAGIKEPSPEEKEERPLAARLSSLSAQAASCLETDRLRAWLADRPELGDAPAEQKLLAYAAGRGALRLVISLVQQGVKVHFKSCLPVNALLHALEKEDNKDVIQYLFREAGAALDVLQKSGKRSIPARSAGIDNTFTTPLVDAKGWMQLSDGEPAVASLLFYAVHQGLRKTTRALIENGANIHKPALSRKEQRSVLRQAVYNADEELIGLLLAKGADKDEVYTIRDSIHESLLCMVTRLACLQPAFRQSYQRITEAFLQAGAAVDGKHSEERPDYTTPLAQAVYYGEVALAKQLLSARASVNKDVSVDGKPPAPLLLYARQQEMVGLIARYGANIRPLAEKKRVSDTRSPALPSGADKSSGQSSAYTPEQEDNHIPPGLKLPLAVIRKDLPRVEQLIAEGAPVNMTALHLHPLWHALSPLQDEKMLNTLYQKGKANVNGIFYLPQMTKQGPGKLASTLLIHLIRKGAKQLEVLDNRPAQADKKAQALRKRQRQHLETEMIKGVKWLLGHGVNLVQEAANRILPDTSLCVAVYNRCDTVARLLVNSLPLGQQAAYVNASVRNHSGNLCFPLTEVILRPELPEDARSEMLESLPQTALPKFIALRRAARHTEPVKEKILNFLLDKGADPNAGFHVKQEDGQFLPLYSPLLLTSVIGFFRLAESLLQKGATACVGDQPLPEGWDPPLYHALMAVENKVSLLMLENGARSSLLVEKPRCRMSLFGLAVCKASLAVVKKMASSTRDPIDIDQPAMHKRERAFAPIALAAQAQRHDMVRLLLHTYHALPDPPGSLPPLCLELFFPDCGKDDEEKASLQEAARPRPVAYQIAKSLLAAGANINRIYHENGRNTSLLIKAVQKETLPLVQFLLAEGANPRMEVAKGMTALTVAQQTSNKGLIKALEKKGRMLESAP